MKWASVHSDEVYFRDTAHGFLAWFVASLFTVALLAGVVRVLLGGAFVASLSATLGGHQRDKEEVYIRR